VHKKSYERRERKDPKRPKKENITTRGGGEGGEEQCTMEMQVPQNSPKTMCNGTYSKRP
jgi:hypothetical protein